VDHGPKIFQRGESGAANPGNPRKLLKSAACPAVANREIYFVIASESPLALQLSFFEVGTLSGGLVSSAPE
jgi:hypothetical protein